MCQGKEGSLHWKCLLVGDFAIYIVDHGFLNLGKIPLSNSSSYFPMIYIWLLVWPPNTLTQEEESSPQRYSTQKVMVIGERCVLL